MATEPKTLPAFGSEEEELLFWDEHDPSDYVEGPADVVIRLKPRKRRAVTIVLDEAMCSDVDELATQLNIPRAHLLRELIRRSITALRTEEEHLAPR